MCTTKTALPVNLRQVFVTFNFIIPTKNKGNSSNVTYIRESVCYEVGQCATAEANKQDLQRACEILETLDQHNV